VETIGASFCHSNGSWVFQDVLPDHLADRAGVRLGAELVAIDGVPVSSFDIPKFAISENAQVAYKNPSHEIQTFSFNPKLKVLPNSIRYVTHKKLSDDIGYIRISKWTGILGMEVARATDDAIKNLSRPKVLVVDIRGNLGSEGAGNLRLMGYLTPEKVPVGYSLTRTRAEQDIGVRTLRNSRRSQPISLSLR
jgi:carboxyl-terminal processing protease